MTPAPPPSRRPTIVLALACAAFCVSRVWILTLAPVERSTVSVFAEMGFEYRAAAARGESFYDLHARQAREAARNLAERGATPRIDPAREKIEYPPLAVAWIVLPTYFGAVGDFDAYTRAFRGLNAAVDVATFLLVWRLARRARRNPAWPLMLYSFCGLALFHLLYDRLDLVTAALSVAAVALLLGSAHWTIAFAMLAAAVNFKLVPIVLAPVFVVGATAVADRGKFAPLVVRALTLIAFCVVMFLPFWIAGGKGTLGFLSYHAGRGVQVESIPANLLLLAGSVTGLSFTSGAIDVVSPAAGGMSVVSTLAMLIVLAGVSLWTLLWSRRVEPTVLQAAVRSGRPMLASAHPRETLFFATLLLWSAMATAKVFSPQYLLWLVPLAALVLGRWPLAMAFVLVCVLTTAIFPYHYFSEIARADGLILLPPTPMGVTLLTLRNGLFVGALLALAMLATIEARRRRG